jgi:hypothetical protein
VVVEKNELFQIPVDLFQVNPVIFGLKSFVWAVPSMMSRALARCRDCSADGQLCRGGLCDQVVFPKTPVVGFHPMNKALCILNLK